MMRALFFEQAQEPAFFFRSAGAACGLDADGPLPMERDVLTTGMKELMNLLFNL